jgi:hypothetical protein
MDPGKLMTVEEVKDFFDLTNEFTITESGSNLKISYTRVGKTTSTFIWKQHISIQQLIRKITQLVYNHCNNIFD